MPPKKAVIGRNTADAKRKRVERAAETPEQREVRLESNRRRNQQSRASETPEQREMRLESNRLRERQSRALETPQQREARLEQVRIRASTARAAEAPQQHENRLQVHLWSPLWNLSAPLTINSVTKLNLACLLPLHLSYGLFYVDQLSSDNLKSIACSGWMRKTED